MLRNSRIISLVGLLCLLFTGAATAAPKRAKRGPIIKDTPTTLATAIAGTTYDFDLTTLLSSQGSGKLNWSGNASMPAWLKLNNTTNHATGNPALTDAGTFRFKISVTDASGEGGDINHDALITVNAPPAWKTDNSGRIDLGIQNEGKAWTFELSSVLDNPAGGSVTYSVKNKPAWMTLNAATGTLSGTPARKDVGNYSGIQFTASGIGGSASAEAYGTVLITIVPPVWTAKNITIDDAKEDNLYSKVVSGFVKNPEGATLTYQIVSSTPPPWININATTSELYGVPKKANIGAVTVNVILTATILGKVYTDTTTFNFNVIHTNHAPSWLANPLNIPGGLTKVPYSQNLAPSATDPDAGDTLTFKIVGFNGPGANWATIDSKTGVLSGTPDKTNVGNDTWTVSVTDQGGLSATTTVAMTITKSNEPPTWNAKPTILAEAHEDQSYLVDLSGLATDPDNDPLTFTQLDGPSWLSISPSGKLVGTPGAADVGLVKFNAKVSDNISGSDTTIIQILISHTNHAPTWVLSPVFSTNEDAALSGVNVAPYATDKDAGDTLTYTLIQGPPWANLSANGSFSGTPNSANLGDNLFKVRVTDNSGLFAETTVTIHVNHVNHAPSWVEPVDLGHTNEKAPFSSNVAQFAKDPDAGDALTFTKVSGPAWVSISASGGVTGTPARADLGLNSIQIRVSDAAGLSAITTVTVTVDRVNTPPRWRQNPIQMTDGAEDTTYTFNLADYAVDDDGDPLTFKLVSGPSWMFVGTNGQVTGVPTKNDIGTFHPVFEVSDGKATAQASGIGQVIHKNHPPVVSSELPLFTVKERQVFQVSLNQPQYVTDADGDKLNFTLIDTSDFVTLSPTGDLTVTAKYKDIGDHTFRFQVDDGQIPVQAVLKIRVLRDPRAPVWLQDPIRMTAKTNEAFSDTLSGKAKDLDGIAITYAKKGGNAWLVVATNGDLSGTPKSADIGDNSFAITVCNDKLCADATLVITVKPGTQIDSVQADSAVAGAPSENLWVVDNSKHCDKTIQALKSNIGVFYNALDKAQLHHTGVFLSSDAHKWDGLPVRAGNEPMTFLWSEGNIVADFNARLDAAYSPGHCSNCYNSPIWSMYRFYDRTSGTSLSDIYHKGYFMPGVPMDAMIISHQRDHYKWYTKGNAALAKWEPADFAKDFIDFHNTEKKSFRISAIAPECPSLIEASGEPSSAGPENAYRVLVEKTTGSYYATGCSFDMSKVLTDYAKKVIFRAYVSAKRQIKLSKTPIDATTVKVTIGGKVMPGNTGGAADVWSYDNSTNSVVIQWQLIDLATIKPGDQISIEYRVS